MQQDIREVNVEMERQVFKERKRIWIKVTAEKWTLSLLQLLLTDIRINPLPPHPNHSLYTSISALALPTPPPSLLPSLMAKSHHMIHLGRLFAQCLVNSRYSRHLCLLDHTNQGSCYRVDTCLASCLVGFLLIWQKCVALQRKNLG